MPAVVAFVTLYWVEIIAVAGLLASGVAMIMAPSAGGSPNSQFNQQQVVRSSNEPHRGIYGRAMVAGPLMFAGESGSDREWLYLVIALCGHETDGCELLKIDDDIAWSEADGYDSKYAGHLTMTFYDGRQLAASSIMTSKFNSWTDQHIGRGLTYIVVGLKHNRDIYPSGIPNVKALVRGKRVWDPRDSTQSATDPGSWKYSDNWALCCLDYVRLGNGVGCDDEEINLDSFIAAANLSDEQVEYQPGQTERRYTLNGTWLSDQTPQSIMEGLLTAGAGKLIYTHGQYVLQGGAYYGPASTTLTEDDLRGDLNLSPFTPKSDLCNAVRGTFISPEDYWQSVDFPPYESGYYRQQDQGEYIDHDLDFDYVISPWTAQRLAKLHLERSRAGFTIEFPAKMGAGQRCWPGMVVRLNVPGLGLNNKEFEVIDYVYLHGKGVDLVLRETAPEIFDYDMGSYTARDLTPNSEMPDPRQVPTVGNLRFMAAADGSVYQGKLDWDAPGNNSGYRYRVAVFDGHGGLVHQSGTDIPQYDLPLLDMGTYSVKVWAINSFGFLSNTPAVITVGSDAPAGVVGMQVDYGALSLTIAPFTSSDIAASTVFEVKGSLNNDLNAAPVIGTGKVINWLDLRPHTRYYLWARTFNNRGSSTWFGPVEASTTADKTGIVDLIGDTYDKFSWYAWADDDQGTGFTTSAALGKGKAFMGVADNKGSRTPSGNWQDYVWTMVQTDIPPVFTPAEDVAINNLIGGLLPGGETTLLGLKEALANPGISNDLLTASKLMQQGIYAGDLGGETPAGAQVKANAAQANAQAASVPMVETYSQFSGGDVPRGATHNLAVMVFGSTAPGNRYLVAEFQAAANWQGFTFSGRVDYGPDHRWNRHAQVSLTVACHSPVTDYRVNLIGEGDSLPGFVVTHAVENGKTLIRLYADLADHYIGLKMRGVWHHTGEKLNVWQQGQALGPEFAWLGAVSPMVMNPVTTAAQQAAEEYALAKANLAETQAKAHADGVVSAEETRAIADAQAKADAARAAAEATAAADATAKADAAKAAAEQYALAKANLAETQARAHADNVVSAEETRAIADAQAKADAARAAAEATAAADATAKADAAKAAAEQYALAKANLAETQARAHADNVVSAEEARAIADAQAKADAARDAAISTAAADATAKADAAVSKAGYAARLYRVNDYIGAAGVAFSYTFPPVLVEHKNDTQVRIFQNDLEGQIQIFVNDNFISLAAGPDAVDAWLVFDVPAAYLNDKTDNVVKVAHNNSATADWGRIYEIALLPKTETTRDAQAKADAAQAAAEATAAADATAKADAAKAAAEQYALAKANLAETKAKAHADGVVSAEETRAIADAQAKADAARAAAEATAAADATAKADAAKAAAEQYALAKANLAETQARAHADNVVSAEETRAIADAQAKADAARDAAISTAAADAQAKADAAEAAAEQYALAKANLAETQARAYADNVVSAEEARAIADAQAKADAARDTAISTAAADAQAKADAAKLAAEATAANQAALYRKQEPDFFFERGLAGYSDRYSGSSLSSVTLEQSSNAAAFSLVPGEHGRQALRIQGSDWVFSTAVFPINTSKRYKLRFKVRQHSDGTGGRRVYGGVATLDGNYNAITGGAGSHRYCAISGQTIAAAEGWQVFEGYITGEGDSHNHFRPGTVYVRPMFIVNYSDGTGLADVDELSFHEVTEQGDLIEIGMETVIGAQSKADAAKLAAEEYALAKANLAETQARAHADNVVSAEEARAIADAQAKADAARAAAEATAAADATAKADAAKLAAEQYALAKANLAETQAKAHADGVVSAEEARAIADAQAKADAAQAAAEATAAADATAKADAAKAAAEQYALAKANLAETQARAHADNVVSAEEARAIADAQAKADAARAAAEATAAADATAKADAAKAAAEQYALAKANLAETQARAHADNVVSAEEARAIADAQAKANAARDAAISTAAADATAKADAASKAAVSYANYIVDAGFSQPFVNGLPVSLVGAGGPLPSSQLTFGADLNADWKLGYGGQTAWVMQGNPVGSDENNIYNEIHTERFAVTAGQRVGFSIYTGAHRCKIAAFIYWFDSAGNVVGYTPLDYNNAELSGGRNLSGYKRLESYGDAPVGAVSFCGILRKHDTKVGENSSYLFYVMPQLSFWGRDQTIAPEWCVGQISPTAEQLGAETPAGAQSKIDDRITATDVERLRHVSDVGGLPFYWKLRIYGESNKYYPVIFFGGNQDVARQIKIWRRYNEHGPDDWHTATHKGALMLHWQGNFGGWGGATYTERLVDFSEQYCNLLANCHIGIHLMGYVFFLRGGGPGGADYHFASDQAAGPTVYYNQELVYDHPNNGYDVYAPAPLTSLNHESIAQLIVGNSHFGNLLGYTGQFDQLKARLANFGGLTAETIHADTALINKLVGSSALFNELMARLAVFGGVRANSIAADAIEGRHIKAGEKLQSPVIEGGKLQLIGSGHMKVQASSPFGPDNLIEWYGPRLLLGSDPNWSLLSKANAITYLGDDGSAYFGGSLSSGTYHNSLATTLASVYSSNSYPVTLGPFGTRGRSKRLVVSYYLSADSYYSGACSAGARNPSLSWVLERSTNGGASWQTMTSGTFNGTTSQYYDGEFRRCEVTEFCSDSTTFTDNTTTTSNLMYRIKTTSHVRHHATANVNSQKLSLTCTEE